MSGVALDVLIGVACQWTSENTRPGACVLARLWTIIRPLLLNEVFDEFGFADISQHIIHTPSLST